MVGALRILSPDVPQSEIKKQVLFSQTQLVNSQMTLSTLPAPETNKYLQLPNDVNEKLEQLLQNRDFTVLDESKITRYQRDFKELEVRSSIPFSSRPLEKEFLRV